MCSLNVTTSTPVAVYFESVAMSVAAYIYAAAYPSHVTKP